MRKYQTEFKLKVVKRFLDGGRSKATGSAVISA
jgi:hypothetical protein